MASNALPPSEARPRRRISPIVWILAGIGVLFLLMLIAGVGSGIFIAHKAREAGIDRAMMERDPELAVAKMMAAIAPHLEIVSIDRERGIVTMRSRTSGKTFTIDISGRSRIGGRGGASIRIRPGGEPAGTGAGPVTLPEWLPPYAGATLTGAQSTQDGLETGRFDFRTEDSPRQVLDFYEAALRKAGMTPHAMREADSGMLSAADPASRREAVVTVERRGSRTLVSGTFTTRERRAQISH